MTNEINNDLVRYSRAGDAFHYRWAARRCLMMLNPLSGLEKVIIEGSSNPKYSGEYVIDMSEYYAKDKNGIENIKYFQLKHTTVHKNDPFNLSDLKKTIIGFANRYKEHITRGTDTNSLHFCLVSNRPIADAFKVNLNKIIENKKCDTRFLSTINNYTGMKDEELVRFLERMEFIVGEGDYSDQMRFLHLEVANLVVGTGEHPQIDSLTGLISDKALPHSEGVKGVILREDILKRFGCTSLSDLFPAPVEYENDVKIVPMEQHKKLVENILESQNPAIIHAAGGVGKSIFAREIQRYLNNDSVAIIYDCFGAGKYRNRSRQRHRYRDALVQINNELAQKGLCDPIFALTSALEDEILRRFKERLQTALSNLKCINQYAKIFLIIDAADNAEMAAEEFGDPCFAHELLREDLPIDCHLVMLCRSERKHMLQPSLNTRIYELESFSEKETLDLLRNYFQSATDAEGREFHRLTNGNPRVQSNALAVNYKSVLELLSSLGPKGTTVDKLIENQLESAIARIQDKFSPDFQNQISDICTGLATLPPYIPVQILAKVAQVEEAMVESFVSDLGRPIWVANSVIQFRDEPTETWFRERYAGTKQQITDYIKLLKPISNCYTYAAEVLPSLLLQAEQYDELIELALSDDFVPNENPIDKRNVIVYRLQFAFKAALKLKRYPDASKIAMLAGEEMAGNKRQVEIFKKNIDLIAPLQDEQKVQELAFKRMISGAWKGSENVYSASLLSNVPKFQGEAQSYLRASLNWLKLFFEDRNKKEENSFHDKLENEDIAEIAFAQYNLNGREAAVNFIIGWEPSVVIYSVASIFSRKMIDLNRIEDLNMMAKIGSDCLYFIIAIAHELLDIGLFIPKSALTYGLDFLSKGEEKLPDITDSYRNSMLKAVISFVELCAMYGMNKKKIMMALDTYFPRRAPISFDSNYRNDIREIYLRSVALRAYLFENNNYEINELLPAKFVETKMSYKDEQDIREYKEILGGLLPWFQARLQILLNDEETLESIVKNVDEKTKLIRQNRYKRFDILPNDISNVCVDILLTCRNSEKPMIANYFDTYILSAKRIWMDTQIRALRGANKLEHLSELKHKLEAYVFDNIEKCGEETETRAEYYIGLSRATLSISKADAAEYFNMAITIVSRFGDEIVERWRAIADLAEQSCSDKTDQPELSYRFIRCGELVGESVASEKYFDRSRALKLCTKLSPGTGLASLSRWRDRDIGWFEDLLPVVITEAIKMGYTSPIVAWAFAMFMEEHSMPDFISDCLMSETDSLIREKLINQGIHLLRLFNTPPSVWTKLKTLADDLKIKNDDLDYICGKISNQDSTLESIKFSSPKYEYHQMEVSELLEVFAELNPVCTSDIAKAYEGFKKIKDSYHNKQIFWEALFKRIPDGDVLEFLFAFLEVDKFELYLITEAFSYMPEHWKRKPSVKKMWPEIIAKIAKKSTRYLLDSYSRESLIKNLKIDDHEQIYMKEGIIAGLIEMQGLETADIYFGFVGSMASLLDSHQARSVLDFSLSRVEMHIEDSVGDGKFSSWLEVPNDSSKTIAGFIWSALGSPSSEIRWKAVHSVKMLGENSCQLEIDALIDLLPQENVQAFGSYAFPFYYLHAKLYLLMAFARISKDNPELLKKHSSIFSDIALNSTQHILMQMHAKRTALNIECAFPNTYEKKLMDSLNSIGISSFDKKIVENKRESVSSIWHEDGKVNTNMEFHHGYDFDRYWFEPLGRIFGIPEKQIEELATMVIVDEWKIKNEGSYLSDPRQVLWNSSRYENKTFHHHYSYPNIETYSFYLSFHSMFVVAARLINSMPVLRDARNDDEDNWEEWLQRFMLTQNNELLLFDRRDEIPLLLPAWMHEKDISSWNSAIEEQYFKDALIQNDESDVWLNVCSSWTHGEGDRREEVYISSAFVETETSQALLNALSSCKNPHDYKIPDYDESRMEFDENPFILRGWIVHENSVEGLDKLDKLSGEIYYPVYKVGDLFAKQMKLQPDKQFRNWYKSGNNEPLLKCKTWSYEIANYGESEQLKGMNFFASLKFLKELCKSEKKEMIIEVQIRRFIRESRYSSRNESKYTPPKHKVFILSMEGGLRDERGNIEIGRATSK